MNYTQPIKSGNQLRDILQYTSHDISGDRYILSYNVPFLTCLGIHTHSLSEAICTISST